MKQLLTLALVTATALASGCAGIEDRTHPAYAPMEPITYSRPEEGVTAGSLYSEQRGISLFSDTRARAVGDIISIVLMESTQASKNAGTSVARESGIDVAPPTIFGRNDPDFSVDRFRGLTLEQSIASDSEFSGNGSTNQSNSLSGAIAVQVARVLPNGNLIIQGEKWLALNKGEEFIQLRGIVRPQDISATNTIPSTLVADARISYGGTGVIDRANSPGWFSKFFNSPLNPF
ncbi:MAG: flagellar basal body L-ring protein FlgH [Gammaproteobacteria bacterium]|jgi:flagellar L-ring protein precursor FlgH|nr:flagellar basal body L-ring protein FlgH [Gammaproteobacteria bacterium]